MGKRLTTEQHQMMEDLLGRHCRVDGTPSRNQRTYADTLKLGLIDRNIETFIVTLGRNREEYFARLTKPSYNRAVKKAQSQLHRALKTQDPVKIIDAAWRVETALKEQETGRLSKFKL